MSEWSAACLGDFIDVKHGYAFQGEFIQDEPAGDVLLTPGNFAIGGGFKGDRYKYYVGPVPDEFVLNEGDLILTMTDLSKESDTLGLPARVPKSTNGRRFLHNQRLGRVVLKSDLLERDFLHYLLCSAAYRQEVLASATGTTVKHTSPDRIRKFEFARPPVEEQQAIAHILGTLDDKIELNRRMSETLEAMARALFKSWCIDFEPVRAKAEGRPVASEFASLLPDAFRESEIGEIPVGWSGEPLDSVAEFLNGLALQKYPPEGEESLPVVKISQLRAGHTAGADRASKCLPSQYVIEDGDVLFSWSGSLECVLWAGGPGALNQHLFKVTSARYPKWFCYLAVLSHLSEFRRIAAGKATTMGHIQRHHLTDAKVAVPPSAVLKAMNRLMEPIVDGIWRRRAESHTLAALRDTLLPKLISGELRVRDAEHVAGRML